MLFEVNLDDKPYERSPKIQSSVMAINEQSFSQGEHCGIKSKETALQMKQNCVLDDLKSTKQGTKHFAKKNVGKESENLVEDHSGSDSDGRQKMNASPFINSAKPLKVAEPDGTEDTSRLLSDAAADPTLPNEVITSIFWLSFSLIITIVIIATNIMNIIILVDIILETEMLVSWIITIFVLGSCDCFIDGLRLLYPTCS